MGCIGRGRLNINVWAYISKDYIVNVNFLAPNSAKNVD